VFSVFNGPNHFGAGTKNFSVSGAEVMSVGMGARGDIGSALDFENFRRRQKQNQDRQPCQIH